MGKTIFIILLALLVFGVFQAHRMTSRDNKVSDFQSELHSIPKALAANQNLEITIEPLGNAWLVETFYHSPVPTIPIQKLIDCRITQYGEEDLEIFVSERVFDSEGKDITESLADHDSPAVFTPCDSGEVLIGGAFYPYEVGYTVDNAELTNTKPHEPLDRRLKIFLYKPSDPLGWGSLTVGSLMSFVEPNESRSAKLHGDTITISTVTSYNLPKYTHKSKISEMIISDFRRKFEVI